MLAGRLGLRRHLGRDRLAADFLAVVAVEVQGLFADQVHDALEVVFQTDGKLHQHGVAAELVAELSNHLLGVPAGAVHLVDKRQPGDAVAAHLPVDRQRLGLHPPYGAEDEDGPVQDAEASLDFHREIDVARRIDQVDVVAVPFHGGGGAGNRDTALSFQVHVVHRGARAASLDFLDAMDAAAVVQDPLAERGLARVDVGRNADVAEFAEVHVLSCRVLKARQ